MIEKRKVFAIDLILIVGTLLMALLTFGYYESSKIVLLSPDMDESFVLFEFVGTGEVIVGESLEFNSPRVYYAKDNSVIELDGGTYYLKLVGEGYNEIRELVVESEIKLMLRESSVGYEIVNVGYDRLDVDVYRNDEYEESVKLGISEGGTR
jgi:hypothetical protein